MPIARRKKIDQLIRFATDNGATAAAELSPRCIQIENRLAAYCRDPKCPHFGKSLSCPPYTFGPAAFRKLALEASSAIVIRLEIDSASLHGEDRPAVMRLLHEITAAVEWKAKNLGFTDAYGFSGGSCKISFCGNHETCRALTGDAGCRYPDQARPSMSGAGINVGELMKSAGWSTDLFSTESEESEQQLAWVAGLVLLS
jgi:predicted metal-binding protein